MYDSFYNLYTRVSDLPHSDDDIGHLQDEDKEQSNGNECQEQAQLIASLVTPPVHRCAVGEEETGESSRIIDTVIGTSPF